MSRVEMEFRRLIQIADPSIRVDRLSPAEVITEGLRLSQFAVAELAKKLDAMERADSEEDGDRLYLVRKSTLLEHGILPEEAHYDSNPRMDGSEPTRKVITWNGVRIGVTHVAGEDYRFGQRVQHDYGRIYGSYGHAGDKRSHDVIIGKNLDSPKIFAIQQLDGIKRDEVKYGIGFNTGDEFAEAYRSPMPNGMRDKLFGGVWEVDPSEFDPYRSDSRTGLVKKKIKVKGKKGEYESTRWIRGGSAAKAIIAGGVVAGLGAAGLAMSRKGKQQESVNPAPIPGKSGGMSNGTKALIGGAIATGAAGVALNRRGKGKNATEGGEEYNPNGSKEERTLTSYSQAERSSLSDDDVIRLAKNQKIHERSLKTFEPITDREFFWASEVQKTGNSLTYHEASGLKAYMDESFSTMNFYLGSSSDQSKATALRLDPNTEIKLDGFNKALGKLPEYNGQNVIVRCKNAPDKDGDAIESVEYGDLPEGSYLNRYSKEYPGVSDIQPGDTFTDPRIVSTTTLREPNLSFTMRGHVEKNISSGLVVYRIKPKSGGTRARHLGNDGKNEAEVVFKPGTAFIVTDIQMEDVYYTPKKSAEARVIYLEEV